MAHNRANGSTVTPTREQVFAEFHARTGHQRFAPDFLTSLWKVMRDQRVPLPERTWAWVRWRALSNHSECPVNDWNPEYAHKLGQIDCGIDLTWLAEGKSLEWVEGASDQLRATKANEINWRKLKGRYSRAFNENKRRGLLDILGHTIYVVPSPPSDAPPEFSTEKLRGPATFEHDEQFMNTAKVAWASNFQAWQDAEKARLEARKVMRAIYREWLGAATSEPPFLTIKTSKDLEASEVSISVPTFAEPSSSSRAEIPTTTTNEPPEPEPEPDRKPPASEVSKAKLRRIAAGAGVYLDDGLLESLIRECRARRPAATEDEIARFLALKLPIAKSKANPPGFLRTAVAACFDGQGLDQFGAYHDDAPTVRCVACGGYGTTISGELCEVCHGAKVMAVASG